MIQAAGEFRLDTAGTLADDEVQALARTFDRLSFPVWIHDLSERCLYRNAAAAPLGPDREAHSHDVVDHCNRVIARLTVGG